MDLDEQTRIVHLAAECAPFAKVGGLGDVVAALPSALSERGNASCVVIPLYGGKSGSVAAAAAPLHETGSGQVRLGAASFGYTVFVNEERTTPTYFLDQPDSFGAEGVYFHPESGLPFENADTRFLVFQLCALDWLNRSDGAPVADVLHLHDHHTGLVPVLLKASGRYENLSDVPTVFTVHSADHQGQLPWSLWEQLGVFLDDPESVLVEDDVNSMKAALRWADAVTTVSPAYADELVESHQMAGALTETFRAVRYKTTGILNGVDYDIWRPDRDPLLPHSYTAEDRAGKDACKREVCAELGLKADHPLVAFVGRLMPEKGVEILLEGAEQIVRKTSANVALLGTGYPEHELEARGLLAVLGGDGMADRIAARIAFDNAFAHKLYAAADIFLMPSRSEPCGLGQMYAMAYGTPPVVHAVGGLRDSVQPWDGVNGTGFLFEAFSADALLAAVQQALDVYADPPAWDRLVRNAMAADWSWDRSARAYAAIYAKLKPVAAD